MQTAITVGHLSMIYAINVFMSRKLLIINRIITLTLPVPNHLIHCAPGGGGSYVIKKRGIAFAQVIKAVITQAWQNLSIATSFSQILRVTDRNGQCAIQKYYLKDNNSLSISQL